MNINSKLVGSLSRPFHRETRKRERGMGVEQSFSSLFYCVLFLLMFDTMEKSAVVNFPALVVRCVCVRAECTIAIPKTLESVHAKL